MTGENDDVGDGAVERYGVVGVTTKVVFEKGGRLWEYTSRQDRKNIGAHPISEPEGYGETASHVFRRFWTPSKIQWWMGLSFMVGALHFLYASTVHLVPQINVLNHTGFQLNFILFVGSIFFTSAAFLQWIQAMLADDLSQTDTETATESVQEFEEMTESLIKRGKDTLSFDLWRPRHLGYMSALFQFGGTIAFNFNTFDAITTTGFLQREIYVWTPNLTGSILFMISAQLAMMEVSHGLFSWKPRSVGWWQMFTNYVGSVAFLISAFASFILPSGQAFAGDPAHLMTAIGAFCFFLGGYLLIPEIFMAEHKKEHKDGSSTSI